MFTLFKLTQKMNKLIKTKTVRLKYASELKRIN